jgi:hypothetical protein
MRITAVFGASLHGYRSRRQRARLLTHWAASLCHAAHHAALDESSDQSVRKEVQHAVLGAGDAFGTDACGKYVTGFRSRFIRHGFD